MITWNGSIFHDGTSNIIESIIFIHDYAIVFMVSILFLVFYSFIVFFSSNYYGSSFYENHRLENCWTISPFLILSLLIVPSLMSLYILDSCFFCGLVVKVVGHQWYWSYFYKNLGEDLNFDSYIIVGNFLRLVDVDNRLVIPLLTPVRFICTSVDVIHSWTIPSFGIKMDAIPGRLNQYCTLANRSGIYFGQCSEICGANHRFMPIVMEVVEY